MTERDGDEIAAPRCETASLGGLGSEGRQSHDSSDCLWARVITSDGEASIISHTSHYSHLTSLFFLCHHFSH